MFSLSEKELQLSPLALYKDSYTIRYPYETLQHGTKIRTYFVPEECRGHPLVRAFVEVLRLQKIRNLTAGAQEFYIRSFIRLCEFISKHPEQSGIDDIGVITPNFRNYLSNHKMEFSYDAIRRMISFCQVILKDACDPIHKFETCDWWSEEIRDIKNCIKPLKVIREKTKLSIKDLFPESKYSDEEILTSMRRVSLWLISEMNSIRREIKRNTKLCLELYNTYDGLSFEKTYFSKYGGQASPTIEKYLGGQLIEVVIESGSPTAIEIMYYNPRRLFIKSFIEKEIASIEEMTSGLDSRLKRIDKRSPRKNKKLIGDKRYLSSHYFCSSYNKKVSVNGLSAFSPLSIFSNTLAEQQALHWFLASERIQPTGLDRLNLSDVIFDSSDLLKARKIQIQFYKGRGDKHYSTSVFKKNTPAFNAIRDYVINEVEMMEKVTGGVAQPGKLFQKRTKAMIHYSSQLSESSILPIKLLGMKGSQMHSKCLSEVDGAEAFLNVLEILNHSNAIRADQMNTFTSLSSRARKDKSIVVPPQASIVKEGMRNLTLSSIAQSRALLEDSDSDDKYVTAALSAHSEETHNSAYMDRYENINKKKELKGDRFAASVGDEMALLAKKVAGFRGKIDMLSEQEINKKLGLSYSLKSKIEDFSSLDSFLNIAKEKGFEVGILGEVSDGSTTYIIQTPITYALISAYINHLDESIEILSVDSDTRAKLANIHKLYLEDILSRFSQKIVDQAKSVKYNFPFPEVL